MRILLGLAILVTLALLASSRRLWAWRRTRVGAALTTGGWVMVGIGMVIGPSGLRLVLPEQILVVQPLVLVCLGWVGLIVGLQADRRLPGMMPRWLMGMAGADATVSIIGVAAAAWAVLIGIGNDPVAALPAALLLGVCAVGWPAEVRSLRLAGGEAEAVTGAIRAVAGLGSLAAVLVYGLLIKSLVMGADPVAGLGPRLILWRIGLGLGVSLLIGLAMGLLGYGLMRLLERKRTGGDFLVVVLGLVTLTAGTAAVLGYSPLFVSMLAGAVVVNLPEKALASLRRGLIEAEQPMAMAVMLVAGVMADPRIGWGGLALAAAGIAARALLKLGFSRTLLRQAAGSTQGRTALTGLVRQSPLAVVMALGYTLFSNGSPGLTLTGAQVLTVVILIGVVVELWPLLMRPAMRPRRRRVAGRFSPPNQQGAGA